jgi:hypothetical protein
MPQEGYFSDGKDKGKRVLQTNLFKKKFKPYFYHLN